MTIPKVYLAGPDVFLPNAVAVGQHKRDVCAAYGLEGLFPLDADLALDGLAPRVAGLRIYEANIGLIEKADACLANLTPYRGDSADVGTAYEVGHMRGLGKPVFAYSGAVPLFAERVRTALALPAQATHDGAGLLIEDFSMVDNLMLDGAVDASGSTIFCHAAGLDALAAFEQAVQAAARALL